jgi:hypothetical protein
MMEAFRTYGFWTGLSPELQCMIRTELDWTSSHMLRMTCTAEAPLFDYKELWTIFWRASSDGYLAICQWIIDVTQSWTLDWEYGMDYNKEDEKVVPYTKLLFWDDALSEGHFELCTWAHGVGLPLRDSCIDHLMINNKLEALKWTYAHGYPLPAFIDELCRLPLIQWMHEEHKIMPSLRAIYDAFRCLPGSEDKALYYLQSDACRLEIDYKYILEHAVSGGHWVCVDFLKKHCPAPFEFQCLNNPLFLRLYQERPDVRFKHWINLDTGLIENDDSSSSSDDDDNDTIQL